MQSGGVSGFYNSPVTKATVLCVALNSICASIFQARPMLHLQIVPHISQHHQLWRLVSTHVAFANSSEILFGGLLMYHMRLIERHWGSRKFASYVVLSSVISTVLDVTCLLLGNSFGLTRIAAGPWSCLYALLYNYVSSIPITYKFKLMGVTLNDKMFVYLLAAQLLLGSYPYSVIPSACGWVTGILLQSDVASVYLKKWRIPKGIWNVIDAYFLKFIESSAPMRRSTRSADGYAVDPQIARPATGGMQTNRAVPAVPAARPRAAPSEGNINLLIGMGFDRERVVTALQATNDDPNAATERLLGA
ncbi:hypothetical protein SmJEL517_g01346 [Synchytrium microbalum]|uniref:UBA domain-containing protein n=1 Tax=Synchytrium microbalum TaxID=1806994 RepID=A0A507C6J2_9FUNG|nr:uncharacterized protein SmJEL517_g01346 [Synchytrium microbalum]TPX36657.1 hypothetical protein SmJEL517_g01346 [Synchytrium microbalum]